MGRSTPQDTLSITRKNNLVRLIESRYGGSQAEFARAIDRAPAQISQWITERRNIGEAAARHIERQLDLAPFVLDSDITGHRQVPAEQEGQGPQARLSRILSELGRLESELGKTDYRAQSLVLESRLTLTRLIEQLETDQK